mmetsp:Transcript_17152/g.25484  ORF Transcript_17152/g.25484 Transcript_17152/m.25484 type:complete len:95 (+) Transcript_17152:1433-1717(+)
MNMHQYCFCKFSLSELSPVDSHLSLLHTFDHTLHGNARKLTSFTYPVLSLSIVHAKMNQVLFWQNIFIGICCISLHVAWCVLHNLFPDKTIHEK